MAVLRKPLDLVIESSKHGLTLTNEVPAFSLEGQVPDGVKDDFELLSIAHFHEIQADQLCKRLNKGLDHLLNLLTTEFKLLVGCQLLSSLIGFVSVLQFELLLGDGKIKYEQELEEEALLHVGINNKLLTRL